MESIDEASMSLLYLMRMFSRSNFILAYSEDV